MNNSYKDKLLISTPSGTDDVFSRSVVLIVEHDEVSSFGFILNNKNLDLSENLLNICNFQVDIYNGGPVGLDRFFFLVKGVPTVEEYTLINNRFYITENVKEIIKQVMLDEINPHHIKAIIGYSGWGENQLETEIQNKQWTAVDVHNLDYTASNGKDLWRDIMQNLGGDFLLFANSPDDIHQN